jgi:hypothetical protein
LIGIAAFAMMFFVHLLVCAIWEVLGTRIPIPTFAVSSSTSTFVPFQTTENTHQFSEENTPDFSLADLQDLFKKILAADIAHFKTTSGPETYSSAMETTPSDTQPQGSVLPSQTRPDIPTTGNQFSPGLLPATKSDTNNTGLLTHLMISGELSLLISCTALALSAGTNVAYLVL